MALTESIIEDAALDWFRLLRTHTCSNELIQFADLASTGTKMPRTNWNDISSFEVALPPNPVPRAFIFAIQPLLNRIHAHLHQSRTLETLRDTLLPELIGGKVAIGSTKTIQ